MSKHRIRISDLETGKVLKGISVGSDVQVILQGKVTSLGLPEQVEDVKEPYTIGGYIELDSPKISIKEDSNEFAKLAEAD